MEYKFFDKGFLVMPDDSHVIGKKVFYSDNLGDLISVVESGNSDMTGILDTVSRTKHYSFNMLNQLATYHATYVVAGEGHWSLAYYDPNYECKVAFSQGKRIQYRMSDTDKWEDILVTPPGWYANTEYRIKPDKESRRMTNKELSR